VLEELKFLKHWQNEKIAAHLQGGSLLPSSFVSTGIFAQSGIIMSIVTICTMSSIATL